MKSIIRSLQLLENKKIFIMRENLALLLQKCALKMVINGVIFQLVTKDNTLSQFIAATSE